MYWLVKICKKKIKLLNIKQKIKIKNKDDYINKEHTYKIFFGGGISTAKISVTIQIKSSHKTLKGILTAKITSDNANKIIVSRDFGGNTYSKNTMIIYNTNDKF